MKNVNLLLTAICLCSFHFAYGQADNMKTAELKKTNVPPTVDGVTTEWANIGFHEIKNICTGDKTKDFTDTYGYWQGVWDDNYLYIHVSVVDDEFATDEETRDILEIYVDMNNNKVEGGTEEPYANGPRSGPATQYAWQWADPTLEFNDTSLFAEGGNGEGTDSLVSWARTNKEDNLGYDLEVAFPWNSLQPGYEAASGSQFSWDINIADIDPGDDVKSDQYWSNDGTGSADPSGEARPGLWYSMAMSGDIILSSDIADIVSSIVNPGTNNIKIFPNPMNNHLNITGENIQHVKIYNIAGSLAYQTNINNSTSCSINVTNLSSGVYFIEIQDDNNIKLSKIIKK